MALKNFDSGCYLFICKLTSETVIKPGAQAERPFPPGYYIYVGRAKKNLRKRLSRHFTKEKKLRWHIDYLTVIATPCYALITENLKECEISRHLMSLSQTESIKGFGASDCNCSSHLHHSNKEISRNMLRDTFSNIQISLYTFTG